MNRPVSEPHACPLRHLWELANPMADVEATSPVDVILSGGAVGMAWYFLVL